MHWIVQSRLRTALVIVFFICLFAVSAGLVLSGAGNRAVSGSSPATGVASLTAIVGIATGIVSILGTISTIVLAWRADRRTAKESDLKIAALQRQIAELQSGSHDSSLS